MASKGDDHIVVAREADAQLSNGTFFLNYPVEDMDAPTAATVFGILDFMGKIIKARMALLRPVLLGQAESGGKPTVSKKGATSYTFKFPAGIGGQIKKEARVSFKLDPDAVMALLKGKGMPPERGASQVWVVDVKKLEALVALGEITPEELAKCGTTKETYALKVKATGVVEAMKDKYNGYVEQLGDETAEGDDDE